MAFNPLSATHTHLEQWTHTHLTLYNSTQLWTRQRTFLCVLSSINCIYSGTRYPHSAWETQGVAWERVNWLKCVTWVLRETRAWKSSVKLLTIFHNKIFVKAIFTKNNCCSITSRRAVTRVVNALYSDASAFRSIVFCTERRTSRL